MSRYFFRHVALFRLLLIVLPVLGAPVAHAETGADWAWAGMRYDIYGGNSWHACSVGYPAWDAAGNRYFITAGHCFRTESGSHYVHPDGTALDIYSPSDHSAPVGFEQRDPKASDGWYTDISLVQMYPGKKLYGDGWEHIKNDTTTADVGDAACLVGFRHDNVNCGEVTATGVSLTLDGYGWSTLVTKTSYCAHHGDSGGAVYNGSGALGIEITGDLNHNEPGTPGACSSSFITIGRVLRFLRQFHPSLSI
ncbi:MAG: S1 family peptidase [Mycobacterium sp.]